MPENTEGPTRCSRCDAPFICEYAEGKSRCWCFDLPPVADLPDPDAGCLCRACLTELASATDKPG
jgi:uncharacterized protein